MAIKGSVPNGALPVLQILSFFGPYKAKFQRKQNCCAEAGKRASFQDFFHKLGTFNKE